MMCDVNINQISKNLHCKEVRTVYQFHVFVRYAFLSSFTFTLYFLCILAVLIFGYLYFCLSGE